MKIKNSDTQYAGLVITMHWLMLVVLALVYACMELRGLATKGTDLYNNVKALHFSLGLCVIGLVVLRVVIRVASGPAAADAEVAGCAFTGDALRVVCVHDRHADFGVADAQRGGQGDSVVWGGGSGAGGAG